MTKSEMKSEALSSISSTFGLVVYAMEEKSFAMYNAEMSGLMAKLSLAERLELISEEKQDKIFGAANVWGDAEGLSNAKKVLKNLEKVAFETRRKERLY